MKYIYVNPDNLELSIVNEEPTKGFVIPTYTSLNDPLERDFYGLVYYSVLYSYVREEDEAKGKKGRKYKLFLPDPWLMALAAIMWQGLIQGLTWDIIKLSIMKGFDFLRSKKLLANELDSPKVWEKSQKIKCSDLAIGFSWTKFSKDGKPLEKLFLGIQREFEKKSEEERELIKNLNHTNKLSATTQRTTKRKKPRI